MTINTNFTPTDIAYTAIGGVIAECVVESISIGVDNAGVVTISNVLTHDSATYVRTDTVCFTTAADCATYLEANVEA